MVPKRPFNNRVWNYLSSTLNEFLRVSRAYITLPSPTVNGQTIDLTLLAAETIVDFTGLINNDFDLNVIASACKKGDKLFLILDSSNNSSITSVGQLNFNSCGPDSPPSQFNIDGKTIVPFMFDGTNFYGLDYC